MYFTHINAVTLCLRFNSEADVFGLMEYLRFENYKVVDYNAGVETIHTELGVSHNKVFVHGGYSIDLLGICLYH